MAIAVQSLLWVMQALVVGFCSASPRDPTSSDENRISNSHHPLHLTHLRGEAVPSGCLGAAPAEADISQAGWGGSCLAREFSERDGWNFGCVFM